jgi:hypothetical protein
MRAVLLLLAGLVAIAGAILVAIGEVTYAYGTITTTAEITAVEQEPVGFNQSEETGTTPRHVYHIRYRYDAAGGTHFGQQTGSTGGYLVGQRVPVRYRKNAPEQSRMVTNQLPWAWVVAAVLLLLGLGLVTLNTVSLLGGKRGRLG